ncbi:hypothetical protein AVEN_180705-1 [Araneus ventricosus]|uniref:Uncharacterized protein n=1 Tax=Araneus ventricosus TaxID=182803 RepID=A0A4Y2G1T6_ARAVE|nr:hypothetical protein AVEN_180705-1 [Araneus ventricosus]
MDFSDTALLYILLGTVLIEKEKPKRKVWARKWLLRRKQKGCYENLMKELALEFCSAKRIVQGILERSKIAESVLIVVEPLSGCSNEIENDVSQAHLMIPMVIGGDSLKVLQPLVTVLFVVSGGNTGFLGSWYVRIGTGAMLTGTELVSSGSFGAVSFESGIFLGPLIGSNNWPNSGGSP